MKYSDAFPDDDVPLVQIEQLDKKVPNLTKEEYIYVLQSEVDILEKDYYKSQSEGTGHFNTAIGVLKLRIEELSKGL